MQGGQILIQKGYTMQAVWSIDQPYVNRLLDNLYYSDRLKLDRSVDQPIFFPVDW